MGAGRSGFLLSVREFEPRIGYKLCCLLSAIFSKEVESKVQSFLGAISKVGIFS